jgi:surface antigen
MFEHSDDLLHKMLALILGALVLIVMIIFAIRVIGSASSSSSASEIGGNPNVVTGGLGSMFGGLNSAATSLEHGMSTVSESTGHAALATEKPIAHAGAQTGHVLSSVAIDSAKSSVHLSAAFIDDTASIIFDTSRFVIFMPIKSTLLTGRVLVRSASDLAAGTSHSVAFVSDIATMPSVTQPSLAKSVPEIDPNQVAIDLAKEPKVAPAAAAPVVAAAPAPAAPAPVSNVGSVPAASTASLTSSYVNDYAWGNCTYWVDERRAEIADPIPSTWGNAATWAERAEADGYVVNHTPSPGAIMQLPNVDYGLGHVAFVESVDSDGIWNISEMNVEGLDVVDHKAMPASAAADYFFIHDD